MSDLSFLFNRWLNFARDRFLIYNKDKTIKLVEEVNGRMMELITESNRAEYYTRMYIDQNKFLKQRVQYAIFGLMIGLMLGGAFLYIMKFSIVGWVIMFLVTIACGYIGWKLMYQRLRGSVRAQEAKLSLMFPEFLQTFIALLEANPTASIVTVLKTSIPYLKSPIRQQVLKLVNAIYMDSTDNAVRESMMDFAAYIGNLEATRIMDLIFSMYREGANPSVLKELEEKVQKLNENKVEAYVSRKAKGLTGKAFPSLVLGIFYVMIYIGLVGAEYLMSGMKFIGQ